jgi:hypothetical protein
MSSDNWNWFARQRFAFIKESLDIYGYVNREHIMRKFGVGVAQAAIDLRRFQQWAPGYAVYNPNAKRYEPAINQLPKDSA